MMIISKDCNEKIKSSRYVMKFFNQLQYDSLIKDTKLYEEKVNKTKKLIRKIE
jgi:hypothetical protein